MRTVPRNRFPKKSAHSLPFITNHPFPLSHITVRTTEAEPHVQWQGRVGLGMIVLVRAGQGRVGYDSAGQGRVGYDSAGQGRAAQGCVVHVKKGRVGQGRVG